MSLRLECHEKTRAEYAEETQAERAEISQLVSRIVAAELPKYGKLVEMTNKDKGLLVAYATQLAYAICRAVVSEHVRRYGKSIDQG